MDRYSSETLKVYGNFAVAQKHSTKCVFKYWLAIRSTTGYGKSIDCQHFVAKGQICCVWPISRGSCRQLNGEESDSWPAGSVCVVFLLPQSCGLPPLLCKVHSVSLQVVLQCCMQPCRHHWGPDHTLKLCSLFVAANNYLDDEDDTLEAGVLWDHLKTVY